MQRLLHPHPPIAAGRGISSKQPPHYPMGTGRGISKQLPGVPIGTGRGISKQLPGVPIGTGRGISKQLPGVPMGTGRGISHPIGQIRQATWSTLGFRQMFCLTGFIFYFFLDFSLSGSESDSSLLLSLKQFYFNYYSSLSKSNSSLLSDEASQQSLLSL